MGKYSGIKKAAVAKLCLAIGSAILLTGCASIPQSQCHDQYAFGSVADPLLQKAWKALISKDYQASHQYADECIQLYAQEAKTYNDACTVDCPPENINCGLLNDVSQCLYVKFEAYRKTDDLAKAKEVCDELNQHYFNSIIFDPRGWMWEPAKACRDEVMRAEEAAFGKSSINGDK